MKLDKSTKVVLSNGAEVWITELPGGKLRLFHAGQTKKKKKKNTDEVPTIEATTLCLAIVDLTFSGK